MEKIALHFFSEDEELFLDSEISLRNAGFG